MPSCPTCHLDAAIGARFCARCGTVLPRRVCQACGTANEIDSMCCIECGNALRLPVRLASPMQDEEDDAPHELGPLARLAELRAHSAAPLPAPSVPMAAAATPTPARADPALLPHPVTATPNAQGSAGGALGSVGPSGPISAIGPMGATGSIAAIGAVGSIGATSSIGAIGTVGPGGANSALGAVGARGGTGNDGLFGALISRPAPPVSRNEMEAVDLYLDLPQASAPASGHDARIETALAMALAAAPPPPNISARVDIPADWTPSEAAVAAASPSPPARLGPYAIGAAVLAFGVAVASGAWLWQRSAPESQAPSSSVRPPTDRLHAAPGAPAQDESARASPSVEPLATPLPTQAAQPPGQPGASGAAVRPAGGVDAAADAALAAAERALAPPGRQATPGASPIARPLPSATPASRPGASP